MNHYLETELRNHADDAKALSERVDGIGGCSIAQHHLRQAAKILEQRARSEEAKRWARQNIDIISERLGIE